MNERYVLIGSWTANNAFIRKNLQKLGVKAENILEAKTTKELDILAPQLTKRDIYFFGTHITTEAFQSYREISPRRRIIENSRVSTAGIIRQLGSKGCKGTVYYSGTFNDVPEAVRDAVLETGMHHTSWHYSHYDCAHSFAEDSIPRDRCKPQEYQLETRLSQEQEAER